MNPKTYLQQIRKCDKMIENKLSELESLRELCLSVTSTWKEDVVQSSGSGDKLGDAIAKIIDLQNEINEDVDRFVDLKREIMTVIDKLDDPCMIEILYKRYFKYEKWEQIAYEMNYGYQWTCKLHGKALQKVKQAIESDTISVI